ncbi:Hsp20 family protein [Thiorhodococcus mannitoliphagus]|uniref:Hsp20 family protein n=1 Tax=Thiorhodococcus mannitoliphagus TaxID=329406 RepID=A0A6P1DSA7_9GAMM|nr:Hsp20 family protein [Thiorhodococcus mannitoliphagus]NEX19801.1 Hsp20 family protein [Thiorhodococcus mannitoliphagus]
MSNIDFSPLLRSMIGFDRMTSALESAYRAEPGGYPPYNIEACGENDYRITMAIAGFSEQDLGIEVKENILTVSGGRPEDADQDRHFLYRGIANRSFERKFQLADYVRVVEARLENGLLHVELRREIPEAMKPRKIQIRSDAQRDGYIEGESKRAVA